MTIIKKNVEFIFCSPPGGEKNMFNIIGLGITYKSGAQDKVSLGYMLKYYIEGEMYWYMYMKHFFPRSLINLSSG